VTIHTRLAGIPYGPLCRGNVLEKKDTEGGGNLPENVKAMFAEMMKGVKEYQSKNDAAVEELKKKGSTDVVTRDELKKLDTVMDEFQKKLREFSLEQKRPILGEDVVEINGMKRSLSEEEVKHKADFRKFFTKGDVSPLMLQLEEKALSAGVNPDGGYTIPIQIETAMNRLIARNSPIRTVATVQAISTGQLQKPFSLGGATSGWVSETGARPQTTTPTLSRLTFTAQEQYAMPAATQTLLDDSAINIEEWLANEVRITFGEQENIAFITGNGVGKPFGLLSYPTIADASWSWGNIGYIFTGQASFDATNPGDDLIDLVYSLKSGYRANSSWIMNRLTLAAVRKFKDTTGQYLWQPSVQAGEPSSLLGYPLMEADDMPDIASNAFPIAFGDFRSGYVIVDRIGTRVLRDPFTAKPYILFYTTKRVGGGVQNFEAFKLLKMAAS
jgi:HK97 family phage major capsid protein